MTQQWSIRNHLHFPAHALLIGEERLREQQAEGARMPEGMPMDEPTGTDRSRAHVEGVSLYTSRGWPTISPTARVRASATRVFPRSVLNSAPSFGLVRKPDSMTIANSVPASKASRTP